MMNTVLFVVAISIAPVIVSYLVEALRTAPKEPKQLSWAPDITIQHLDIDGVNLRFIKTGTGEPLILLHTLRTQLDMFQKMIPLLSERFTVYAIDYPGHGYSDIPDTEYTPQYLLKMIEQFLENLNIQNATVAGESIGATLALMLVAKNNSRIKRAVSINPYDYGDGLGVGRGSWVGRLLFGMNNIPLLGATNWRLRVFPAFLNIMRGGVYDPSVLPNALMREINNVGNRSRHYLAFMSLIRNFPKWELEKQHYEKIRKPVLIIYGDHDWSTEAERLDTKNRIKDARIETLVNGGHFLSLEQPDFLTKLITEFADSVVVETH